MRYLPIEYLAIIVLPMIIGVVIGQIATKSFWKPFAVLYVCGRLAFHQIRYELAVWIVKHIYHTDVKTFMEESK